jgi:hypothetical protein
MIVDYRKSRAKQAPIYIDGAEVDQVERFKFHGVHITIKLSWSKHTNTVVKRARQHLFSLRRLKIFGVGPQILKKYGPVHHWCQASCHPGPLYQAVSGKPYKLSNISATLVIDCFFCYCTASGTGAPSLGPKGSLTDFTPKP